MRLSLLTLALALFAPFGLAVTGPDAIHYQGVLRDASDSPQDGGFDMQFRFFDAESGGNEILVDAHLASGTGAVDVSGGLFAVALGSGAVSDGSGPGTYTSLALVFASFPNVWLEIDVEGETLSPRAPLFASPYAHNATYLDGRASSGYINTTSESQTKSGTLTLGALSVNNLVTIKGGSPGEGRVLTSNATGTARWETPPVTAEAAALGSLADRLRSTDPAALPFATLRPFDCSRTPATLTFAADGTTLGSVVGFLGTERISAPFEFLVSLESATPITTAAQVGRIGKVTIARDTGTTTYSGRITEFSAAGFDPGARTYLYVARLEPRIGDLARRSGYSVRQSETILETIDAKLAAAGVTSRQFITSGVFPVLDMTIQYDESELAFVSRLAENDGVHFHFREIAGGDEVVFGDANSVFPAIARPLSYVGDQADPGDGSEYVATFLQRQRTFSGTGRVRGYRVESPATPTDAASTATGGTGEIYEYFAEDVSGSRASNRAQQIIDRDQTRRFEHAGSSNAPSLRAGRVFTLDDTTGAGLGGTYVVTSSVHFALRGKDEQCIVYGNVFEALPNTVTYRPPRMTPKPVVPGPVNAKVTGPVGSTTFVDTYGRVRVLFSWDRTGAPDETSSGWVRVAVPPGRLGERQWRPEIGDEVLVGFQQGDPDRPVVIGSLYNGDRLAPTIDNIETGGDITIGGADLNFGPGGNINASAGSLLVRGDSDTDDLFLYAGDAAESGSITIRGENSMELRAGNGSFSFVNGATGNTTASLNNVGDLEIDGKLTLGSFSTLSNPSGQLEIANSSGVFRYRATSTGSQLVLDNSGGSALPFWRFDAPNLDLYLGSSGADEVLVPGNLSVSGVKNFVQNHPYRDDLSVVYTALEGDEAGTYTRGSGRLEGGVARIPLGETFAWVTNPELGLTAHVTPRGTGVSLYVESVTTTELVVRSDDPSGAIAEFDYIVHGLRIGYEEYGVVQPRRMDARVPSPAAVEARFAADPTVRNLDAASRFRAIDDALGRGASKARIDDRANTLRAAIGMHDGYDEPLPAVPLGDEQTLARDVASDDATQTADEGRVARAIAGTSAGAHTSPSSPDTESAATRSASRARALRTEEPELATSLAVTDDVTTGDLVVVDRADPARLRPAAHAADPAIVGIVSGRPGVLLGADSEGSDAGTAAVALSGIVVANVDAGYGAIAIGDLLTSSPTPGHAMRALEATPGTIVGKALEPLAAGTGQIRVLVMLR